MRFRSKPAGVVVGPIDEGSLNLPGRLRARRQRRGRAVQVHGDQPLHARAHAARRALSRLPRADAGDRRRARGAGRAISTCACVQVDEANIPGNPADGPLAAEAINRVLDAVRRPEGRALLLRQLRRADDSDGHVERADRVPQRAARRSSGARAGAPARVGSRRAAGAGPRHRHRRRRGGHQGQPRRDAGRDRRAPSSAPSRRSARTACATCIRTAGSGCSSARWPTARSPRSSRDGILYLWPTVQHDVSPRFEVARRRSRCRRSTSSCCTRGRGSRSATASRA